MNKNFAKFAFAAVACVAFCTMTFAAPKSGHHGGGRPAGAVQHARTSRVARPATRTSVVKHSASAHHVRHSAAERRGHFRPEARHHAAPPRVAHHHVRRHRHAHYWTRPAVPLVCVGALHAWVWVEQAWMMVVNGVCYHGDGYYYDGYNYYYNGEYHTVPPPLML